MMLMPASAEFAALCQSQIAMMAEMVGADSTAVYLAESWSDQARPKLIPIAVYPPAAASTTKSAYAERALPGDSLSSVEASPEADLERAATHTPRFPINATDRASSWLEPEPASSTHQSSTDRAQTLPPQRLAVPMIHEGGVFGIVVSWRADRPWQPQDRDRLEEYARSLTLACVLDQRGQWLKSQLSSLDRVQTQQSDRFHELLHQLRSPLTALKTFGKLLTKRLPREDANQSLVVNMLRESDRMQELLGYFDDTLQAADETREATSTTRPLLAPADSHPPVMEAEALPAGTDSLAHFGGRLHIQPCLIDTLIKPVVELTRSLAEATEMTFQVEPPDTETWVQADGKALIEILNNFIDNALKYSPPGTQLWLQWGLSQPARSDLTGILIGDTGPGIPLADQTHIFERHFRGIQAAGPLTGSGLGLAIVADLVHEMKGELELFSPLSKLPWPLPPSIQAHADDYPGTAFVAWLPKATTPRE
jgi:signal transduction histidine kinase